MARRAPWGARKRLQSGSANDTRLAPPACSEPPEMARMDTGPAQRQPYSPRRHVPRRHRTLQGKVRCRAIKCRNRVPASLVQIGRLHLWNNEPHNEGHPHCKKLIVDNEPIWAHYQNNEPCSLCQKYNEGNNEGNNDAHCWAHCWRNTMRATMRLIVGERAPF